MLRQRPTDDSLKHYAVSYMDKETNSFDYTRAVLRKLDTQARREIERLGGNPGLSKFLDRMVGSITVAASTATAAEGQEGRQSRQEDV